jgi:hypothetical protein
MQVFFGRDIDADVTTGFFCKNILDEDTFYQYGVEYGSLTKGLDVVLLYDADDQHFSVGIENLPDLILALEEILLWQQRADEAQQVLDNIQDTKFSLAVGQ